MADLRKSKAVNIKYINWQKEAELEILKQKDFVEILKSLDKNLKVSSKTKWEDYKEIGSWNTFKSADGRLKFIYLHKAIGKYVIYSTNVQDDTKNDFAYIDKTESEIKVNSQFQGPAAYKAVNEKFKEQFNTSFKKAFDTTEVEYKMCVPKQFYWINKGWINKVVCASAIDFCSQYPTNLCGAMPDGHNRKVLKGRHKPTKDYPFAFYLTSHTVAEFNEYDTHDWVNSKFAYVLFTPENLKLARETKDEDEITVLMKASKYHFDDIMKYFYELRKIDPIAKLVMNAFIGMLHTKTYINHKYTHLAAISIARSNEKMRRIAESLDNPIHICVDGCVYLDDKVIGVDTKALGNCYQEFTNCGFKMMETNVYVAMKDGKVVKFKHGAFNARKDGKDIDSICEGYNDMKQWYKNTELQEVLNYED